MSYAMRNRLNHIATLGLLAGFLAACNNQTAPDADEPAGSQISEPSTLEEAQPEPISILRPEIVEEELPPPPLEPLDLTIGFPQGGAEIDEAAVQILQNAIESEQLAQGGPITLGAHSDSSGSDRVNERASMARGRAVARWLIDNGVEADRIELILFGEQNPIAPNALPDGSPNDAGRAANRRVEIHIGLPDEPALSDETEAQDATK